MRLTGTLYCRAEVSAPWGVAIPDLRGAMMFGIVTEGRAWVQHRSTPPREVAPGSFWLFPRGCGHRIFSDPKARIVALDDLPVQRLSARYETLRFDGGGARCKITYGIVRFDASTATRLIDALPDVMHIDAGADDTDRWLASTVDLISREARTAQLGGETVLTHLADIIVIQAIRSWLDRHVPPAQGWLAAVRDEHIGRALAALHENPGDDWSLARLSRVAGMARSSFALRFNELLGEPPMSYVTWFRMETARTRLRDTMTPLADIARDLGYRSEASFGRAFKRVTGTSPGRWRTTSRQLSPAEAAAPR